MQDGVLRRTMPRLCDGTDLQRHRGMQSLSATWASSLRKVEVLLRTMPRLCDCTDLQRHRGMQTPLQRWRDWARDALVFIIEFFCGGWSTLCVFLTICSLRINDHVLYKCQCYVAARAILHSHTRCLLYSTCLSARVYSPTSGFSRFQFTIFFSMSLRTRQP